MPNHPDNEAIGKTSSPFRMPNTTNIFHFWVKSGIKINPFDFIVAEHFDGSKTVGIVDEIFDYTDSDSHLTDYIGCGLGDPSAESYIDRVSTMVGRANVLRNMPISDEIEELYMPVPAEKKVYYGDLDAISKALGYDVINGIKIPAGLIKQSNNVKVPVFLDSDYIIGPEAAHVNASGISGLATKTSYLMFLIYSMYKKIDNLSLLLFNVKHSDLLHIHEKAIDLSDEDKEMYEKLELSDIGPFKNVKYFLPRGDGGPDSDEPPSEHTIYSYELADVYDDLDLLFAEVPDTSYTIDAFVHQIRRDWTSGQIEFQGRINNRNYGPDSASTWQQLLDIPNDTLGASIYNWPSHPTPPRIKRELRRLTDYSAFVERKGSGEVYLGNAIRNNIRAGHINVIDIYRVHSISQPFIIGDVMRNIEELYRQEDTSKLPHLIIFIDELNTFAPATRGTENLDPITGQIIEIARKGRARRTALFGAQQFKSEVHGQVWGNCTLNAIGRTGSAELRAPAYHELPEYTKNSIMALKPGEMVLSFKIWRAPIKIKFPKPPYRRPSKQRRNINTTKNDTSEQKA